MFKYTKYLLEKIESIYHEMDYTVRYEKGTFQSGYCIVDTHNIVVVNKFFDTEARINCLLEILDKLPYDPSQMSESAQKTLKKVQSVLTAPDT